MGYSARYHATSLIAVFLALAVGILIGAEFGGDALTQTRKNLENSLVGNLQDARGRVEDLNSELGHADEFDEKVYPVLTRDRLQGKQFALIAFGNQTGSSIVAEGVETAAEMETLRDIGVHAAQGYHLAHPLVLADLLARLPETFPPAADLRLHRR